MEAILPLLAVRDGGELERGAVQQDELLVAQCVHLLDFVAQFYVLRDGLVKVGHSGVLGTPATEKGILLDSPDDLEPCLQIQNSFIQISLESVLVNKISIFVGDLATNVYKGTHMSKKS